MRDADKVWDPNSTAPNEFDVADSPIAMAGELQDVVI